MVVMPEPADAPPRSAMLGVASLVLATVSLAVFGVVAVTEVFQVSARDGGDFIVAEVVAVVLGASAVATGVVSRRRVKRGQAGGAGVALVGIVLGAAAAIVPAILGGWVAYQLYFQYQQFQSCIGAPETASPRYLCLKECPSILDSLCRKAIGW
jgi:hypothetical protein